MPYKDEQKRKEYHAAYIKKWDAANREKRREATKKSMQKWREEDRERSAQKMREWRAANKSKSIAQVESYKKNNPEKAEAHRIVKEAIRKKEIRRLPCEICGEARSQAHHEDYSRPLYIQWLCQKHHSEKHK